MTFVGRWSPFHKGHIALINTKREANPNSPVLIMVRNTSNEAYSASVRAEYIKAWMEKEHIAGTIMIVPNVEGVYWGRKVGYNVGEINVDQKTARVSGTKIRNDIALGKIRWKHVVANTNAAHILSPAISNIIDNGFVVWLTGCPSSGKTTMCEALTKELKSKYPYLKIQVLDGDHVRTSPLAQKVGFTKMDRAEHIRRMAYLAKLFADHGILVICAFVSPERKIRREAKRIIGKERFMEVYMKASQKIRIQRDVKGMYKKAAKGELVNFTGYNGPYEQPEHPDVICNTDKESIYESLQKILKKLFDSKKMLTRKNL